MSFYLAIEWALLHTGVVDNLTRFVVGPQPTDDLVTGVERGLLAFEKGIFGGNFFEKEVLG